MDPIIQNYPYLPFDELNYCHQHGILYQRDMSKSVDYDKHYFESYVRKAGTDIAKKLNVGRAAITEKYCDSLLDIGVGSGEFIKESGLLVYGFDINPVAIKWLREGDIYRDPYHYMPQVDGLTFWDSLEHIPNPTELLNQVRKDMFLFVSIPIFTDLLWVKKSKHYKPDEHYYYYTAQGLMTYMNDSGFETTEISDHETRAGREDILTFVFKKR